MGQMHPESPWQLSWIKPRLQWNTGAIRPAEIGDGLCRLITARENVLEDANYNKVLPNHFVIELNPTNYAQYYEPLANDLIQQWRDRLVEHVKTTNERLGRKEYRLVGQVHIDLLGAPDIKSSQARVLTRIVPDFDTMDHPNQLRPPDNAVIAYLDLLSEDRRWPLFPGDNTIGRSKSCSICLDLPLIQEKRLVSSQHATLRVESGQYILYDGAPGGKPSANGTYVNSKRVSEYGTTLQDGDVIILAALDAHFPRWDTPGVAAFRLRKV
jgi:hypothetical protein